MRVPTLGCSCIQKNSKSKKGHYFVKKFGGLPPFLVWVSLLIVNNYSEFQVNIFSKNSDIRKCPSFRTTPPTSPFSSKTAELTINHGSPMQIEKSQPSGQRIMPETR